LDVVVNKDFDIDEAIVRGLATQGALIAEYEEDSYCNFPVVDLSVFNLGVVCNAPSPLRHVQVAIPTRIKPSHAYWRHFPGGF
jgi:hypothetical protein